MSQYPTRDNPRQIALSSRDQAGRHQLVLAWHEVIPGRMAYDSGSGASFTSQPTTTRWHAQTLAIDPHHPEIVERGHEVTGLTENEAMARALVWAVGALGADQARVTPVRREQLSDAKHETMFAVMAFEAGDLGTAKRSVERAHMLFDGDTCCQYCGGDEREQGVYAVCRRCFWTLREADANDRTKGGDEDGGEGDFNNPTKGD